MNPKPPPDWDAIYAEFRLDLYSNRELAGRHGISEAGIRKKAKKEGWCKDLSGRVKEAVRAKMVRADGEDGSRGVRGASMRTLDAAIVDAAAQKMLSIQNRHRAQLKKLTNFAEGLMDELARIDASLAEIDKWLDEDEGRLASDGVMAKRLKLNSFKASVLESLARTYHRLLPLERQSYGLDMQEDHSAGDAAREIREIISGIRSRFSPAIEGESFVKDG